MRNHNGIVTANDGFHRRAAPAEPEDRNPFTAARLEHDAETMARSLAADPEFREWVATDELIALVSTMSRTGR